MRTISIFHTKYTSFCTHPFLLLQQKKYPSSFPKSAFPPRFTSFFNLLNQLSLLSSVSSTSSSLPSFSFTIAFKQLKRIRPFLLSAPLPLHSQVPSLYAGSYWLIWIVITYTWYKTQKVQNCIQWKIHLLLTIWYYPEMFYQRQTHKRNFLELLCILSYPAAVWF